MYEMNEPTMESKKILNRQRKRWAGLMFWQAAIGRTKVYISLTSCDVNVCTLAGLFSCYLYLYV